MKTFTQLQQQVFELTSLVIKLKGVLEDERASRKVKKGHTVYVVMMNDVVDSIWTKQTKANKRADTLHNPNPESCEVHPRFARVTNLPLNTKGKW